MKGILRGSTEISAQYQTVTTQHGSSVWCYRTLEDNLSGSKFFMIKDFEGYASSLKVLIIPEVFL